MRGFFLLGKQLHSSFTFNFSSYAQKRDRAVVIGTFFAGFHFKGIARSGESAIDIGLTLALFVA